MDFIFTLGRNRELSLKELQSLLGEVRYLNADLAIYSYPANVDLPELTPHIQKLQNRLGGTLKISLVLGETKPDQLNDFLLSNLGLVEGKFSFGFSCYGLTSEKIGLSFKKALRSKEIGGRFILAKEGNVLSTAQVFHNQIAGFHPHNKGAEYILFKKGNSYLVAQTLTVQDIDFYGLRDFEIPYPDAESGMLPPKLAQTMINLGLGLKSQQDVLVYDPFCGNGRVVEEAYLMGYQAFGSDVVEKKVESAQKNLDWLAGKTDLIQQDIADVFWQQDATEISSTQNPNLQTTKQILIVAEPYLGRPLRTPLRQNEIEAWSGELENIYLNFMKVWQKEGERIFKMIIVFPKPKTEAGPYSLLHALLDRIEALGYNSSILSCFERPDALVSREIVEITYRS